MNNTESINEKIIQNMIEITDFDAPELDVYARLTEAQLLNKDHPEDGLFIAESPKVISRALDGGYEPVSVLSIIIFLFFVIYRILLLSYYTE